jgi:hypothetical protein
MALATVIFALTMMAVIGSIGIAIGVQEARIGSNSRYSAKAFGAAEAGIALQLAQWKVSKFDTLTPGDSTVVSAGAIGGGYYSGVVRRLSTPVFVVTMTGTEHQNSSQTQTRLGQVVLVRKPHISIKGALTTSGSVTVGGNSMVSGTNTAPSGWTGCPPGGSLPGITVPNANQVTVNGNATSITGTGPNPSLASDTTINTSTFQNFGSTTYSQLAAGADIQLPGGPTINGIGPVLNGNGSCNSAVTANWGDGLNPSGACGGYYPVIHIASGVTINGGQGQGILLVDGDLKLSGGFTFFGIVITTGTFDATGNGGNGATVYGAVLAQNANISTNVVNGGAQIQYSSCVVQAALAGAATASPLNGRGWFTQ